MCRTLSHSTILMMVSACLASSVEPVWGAVPPPPREIQEVRAVLAQAPPLAAGEMRPLKIVLTANRKDHGPHEHDYPRWMERWSVLLGGQAAGDGPVNLYGPPADLSQGPPAGAAGVVVETAEDWPSPRQFAQADLVVAFIGTGGFWDEAKLRDVQALLKRGAGFVAVHSAVIAEQETARPLAELIGLAWESGHTLFRHGPVDLKIVAPEHPICKGLPAQIHFEDETYWPLVGEASHVNLLATADEMAKDGSGLRPEPMFWTLRVGQGRVYSCILGHYTWTFDDPYFRILMLRGMAWAAGESPYRFDPLVLCGARTSDQKRAAATMLSDVAPMAPDGDDPNLLLWLDASDRATLTVDDDGYVAAWSSKTTKVNHKLTSTAAQRPLYVAESLGGQATLRFDGIDDVLRDTTFGQSAQAWTLVLVVKPQSNMGNGQFHALVATNRPGQNDYITGLNVDLGPSGTQQFSVLNLEGVKDSPGATNLRTETAPFGEGQIIILGTGEGCSRLWINGAEEESRLANEEVTAMDELRIGGRFYMNLERGFFHGDISEVIIYRMPLTDTGRAGLYTHLQRKYGPDIKPPASYMLDTWDYLPAYDWGQTRRPLEAIDEAIRDALGDTTHLRTLESRLLNVLLDPSATPAAKDFVCRRLAIVGSEASVGPLAELLHDEGLSTMACFALERIAGTAPDEALCLALGEVQGSLRVEVIDALGSRRSLVAVDHLAGFLGHQDRAIRQATIIALGKIGGSQAAELLRMALGASEPLEQAIVAESLLMCAEQFLAADKQAEALAIYERLCGQDVTRMVRIAALRGTIVARGVAALPLLLEQLNSDDSGLQTMALLLVRQMQGVDVTKAVASHLSSLRTDRQVRLIEVLADRNDKVAKPAIIRALRSDQLAVRLAAARAMRQLGDVSDVPLLLNVAAHDEQEVVEAITASLAGLSGGDVDVAMLETLDRSDVSVLRVAIDALGRRACVPATPALIAQVRHSDRSIRLAAIEALGETAGSGDISSLMEVVLRARDAGEMAAVEKMLTAVYARTNERDLWVDSLLLGLSHARPMAKVALLRALSRHAGPEALQAVRTATTDADPEVREAAIRMLCDWADAGPADDLLTIARQASNERHRLLALRGYLRMAGQDDLPSSRRLAMCKEGLRLTRRDQERRLALSALAGVPSVEALTVAVSLLEIDNVSDEVGATVLAVGETLLPKDPAPVIEAVDRLLEHVKNPDVIRRATELRTKAKQIGG